MFMRFKMILSPEMFVNIIMRENSEVEGAQSTIGSDILNQTHSITNNSQITPDPQTICFKPGLFSCQGISITTGLTKVSLLYLDKPIWQMSVFAQEQYSTKLLMLIGQDSLPKTEYNYLLKGIYQIELPKRLKMSPLKPNQQIYQHLLFSNLNEYRKGYQNSPKKPHVREWEALSQMLNEAFQQVTSQQYTNLTINYPFREYHGRLNRNFLTYLREHISLRSTLDMSPLRKIVIVVKDKDLCSKIQEHFFEAFRPQQK